MLEANVEDKGKENTSATQPVKRRRVQASAIIENTLAQRIEQDELRLAEARACDKQHHEEIVSGQQQIIEGLNAVARGLDSLVKDRADERREMQKHQLDMIAMFRDGHS